MTTLSLEDRSKSLRRLIVSSGMRVGRNGAFVVIAGLAVAGFGRSTVSFALPLGLVLAAVGALAFYVGWTQSKSGTPFLRALSEEGSVKTLYVDPKQLAGDRRSISVLLTDGAHSTVALKTADAAALMDVVCRMSASATCGEQANAARAIAQLAAA